MFTPQFDRYVQPARSHPQIWRLISGIVVIMLIQGAWVALIFFIIRALSGDGAAGEWIIRIATASTPTSTILLLSIFGGLAIGPMVAVRLLHKRPVASLFGPRQTVLGDFARSAGVVTAIYAVFAMGWSLRFDAVANLDFGLWLAFLPLALLGVLVQTGAEELVFRGYLQQQLAARFSSPLIWLVIPSVTFGLIHYDPASAGGNTWLIVAAAAGFGLAAADLTRVTGSIGAAWGFHFANNIFAILLIAVDGTIPGLALFLTPYGANDAAQLQTLIGFDLLAMIIAWATLRRLLRR